MTEYHVVTPDEEQWVGTPKEVSAVIARYMEKDKAVLAKVTVIKMADLPPGQRTGQGEPLAPGSFWPQTPDRPQRQT